MSTMPTLADFGLDEKELLVTMSRDIMAELIAAEKTIKRLTAERLTLDRRIHNQRVQNRTTWETVEMRAGYKHIPEGVRSRMLAAWCARSRECDELRKRLDAHGQAAPTESGPAAG